MKKFILGVFDNVEKTREMLKSLKSVGIPQSAISFIARDNLINLEEFDISQVPIDSLNDYGFDAKEYQVNLKQDKVMLLVEESFEAEALKAQTQLKEIVINEKQDAQPIPETTITDEAAYYSQGEEAKKAHHQSENMYTGLSDVKRPVTPIKKQNQEDKFFDR